MIDKTQEIVAKIPHKLRHTQSFSIQLFEYQVGYPSQFLLQHHSY